MSQECHAVDAGRRKRKSVQKNAGVKGPHWSVVHLVEDHLKDLNAGALHGLERSEGDAVDLGRARAKVLIRVSSHDVIGQSLRVEIDVVLVVLNSKHGLGRCR